MRRDRGLVTLQVLLAATLAVAWIRSLEAVGLYLHLLSVACLGTGALIGGAALWQLRHSFRVAPTPRADGRLVTHGIYRWLRHPMYTAVVAVVIGLAVLRPDPPVLVAAAANLAFYLAKARYEEGLLLAHYPGYAAYRRRTVGVLPGW